MIDKKEVENIAMLSRLELNDSEKVNYQKELSEILSFVEKINKLDLTNVEPTNHILDVNNVMRDDISKESLDRKKVLTNVPSEKDGFIVVPKVVQ